jgi:hypothetical protein
VRGGEDVLVEGRAAFNLFDARPEVPSLFLFPEGGFEETGVSLVDDSEAEIKGGPEVEPSAIAMSLLTTAAGSGIAGEGMEVTGGEAEWR